MYHLINWSSQRAAVCKIERFSCTKWVAIGNPLVNRVLKIAVKESFLACWLIEKFWLHFFFLVFIFLYFQKYNIFFLYTLFKCRFSSSCVHFACSSLPSASRFLMRFCGFTSSGNSTSRFLIRRQEILSKMLFEGYFRQLATMYRKPPPMLFLWLI